MALLNTGGVGGNQILLQADTAPATTTPTSTSFNVSSGASVSQGDLIGFNGDSVTLPGALHTSICRSTPAVMAAVSSTP